MKNLLAVDLGASNGRTILGGFDGNSINLTESYHFENNPVMLRGVFYWDVLNLFHHIKSGMMKARLSGGFDSVGIDTWGVDFGLLDKNGQLKQNPVHYRDRRTEGSMSEVFQKVGKDELYEETGVQFMEINTVFQLYTLAKNSPELLEGATALLMPDLFGYLLTGEYTSEFSIASTTQLMNPRKREWSYSVMNKLGIPDNIFPNIVESGRELGKVSADISEETGPARVITVAGHDTASAVAAVPSQEKDFIYISCGTWSLFGTETDTPLINEKSLRYNITNEGGYGYTNRFLKNIIGLWIIQETRRQYRREGQEYSYADLEAFALGAKPFRFFIDPDAPEFGIPGNMPRRIREFCERTGQGKPETVGEIMRCIYESLAMKYRYTFEQIKDVTGKSYGKIHMIGGGTKDTLLCQMTANAIATHVLAGPIEATALGNIAIQLIASGEIASLAEARRIIAKSFVPVGYEPKECLLWDEAYGSFMRYAGLKE